MSMVRTARRRRKQMRQNNNHLSGMGVPRYLIPPDQGPRISKPTKGKK